MTDTATATEQIPFDQGDPFADVDPQVFGEETPAEEPIQEEVATEEAAEPEAEEAPAEVVAETETEAATPASTEPDDDASPWVLDLRVNHEDVEYDLLGDLDKTREYVQKGMDYDRKHGVERAVQDAQVQAKSEVLTQLEQLGAGRVDAFTGQWQWTPAVEKALRGAPTEDQERPTTATPSGPTTADAELDGLRQNAGRSVEDLDRFVAAHTARVREQVLTEVKSTISKEREAQTQAQRTAHVKTQTREHFEQLAQKAAGYFKDPFTGEVDEEALNEAAAEAFEKAFTTRQLAEGVNRLQSLAKRHLNRNKAAWQRAKKSRPKPSAPTALAGKPSTRATPTNGRKSFDPSDPFGHIE